MFNVLLVDDEPWVLEGLRTMIDWNRFGFRICGEASSAPEALNLIEELRPELVMTDIHMPVLNGLELIEHINRMQSKPPKFVILSGYDDFHYAHVAMRQRVAEYLLKPIDDEEIEALLAKLRTVIEDEHEAEFTYRKQAGLAINYLVNRLIQGEFTLDLAEQTRKAMNIQGEPELRCMLIEADNSPTDLIERITERFPRNLLACFQDSSGRVGAVLRHDDDADPCRFMDAAFQFQLDLATDPEKMAIIAFSDIGRGVQTIGEMYRQTMEVRDTKRSRGRNGVFYFQDMKRAVFHRELPQERIKELSSYVTAGEPADIELCVERLFAVISDHLPNLLAIKADVADLELTFCRQIHEMNGDPDMLMNRLQERLGNLGDVKDYSALKNYVRYLALQAASLFTELRQKNESNTIYQVIQYVDREYRSKLQLQELAQHFHMNSTYLGQLFKKHAGKPFKEYLNEKRIEEAKLLLKRSGMKVSEVALHVGFPNADYFIHKFKITTGVLPSVYKNQCEGKQR